MGDTLSKHKPLLDTKARTSHRNTDPATQVRGGRAYDARFKAVLFKFKSRCELALKYSINLFRTEKAYLTLIMLSTSSLPPDAVAWGMTSNVICRSLLKCIAVEEYHEKIRHWMGEDEVQNMPKNNQNIYQRL